MNEVRRYGLLGDPVSHSLSPRLYAAAFAHLRVRATYETRRVERGDSEILRRGMHDFGASGGGNVTVPHKQLAAAQLEIRSGAVERTGACNCFWFDREGRLAGDNTDVGGFLDAAPNLEGLQLEGASVLLLGAGGAARAVAVACAMAGVKRLAVHNRTNRRAETLVADLGIEAIATACSERDIAANDWDLVVNATSLGLDRADPLPMALEPGHVRYAFDLVYGQRGTRWTWHAAAVGVPAIDGLTMLVSQAALSLENWLGPEWDREGVTRAMWQEVERVPRPESG